MKQIYIAGPDVFEPDAVLRGEMLVSLCEKYGYKGLYPMDNIVDFSQEKHKIAWDIYDANVAMIERADIVIANLNPFRGKEADSGTVWECGYAYAKGKKVYGYMSTTYDYKEHFSQEEQRSGVDADGKTIEDFALPINLMIACSVEKIIEGSFEDVLIALKGNA